MPGIADASDPNWSETIQKNWPVYIMGISQFWLGLINDAVPEAEADETDIEQLLQQYKQANDTVTALWQTEGEHALLHLPPGARRGDLPPGSAHAASVMVDAMRGRSTTWTRIRVNLRNVPEKLRPPQEPLDPDDTTLSSR